VCKVVCDTVCDILFTRPNTSVSILWVPGTVSFNPLKRLQEITSDVAAVATLGHHPPAPTITALQDNARHQALSDQPPEFVQGSVGFA
jgi:hypothetical protein